MKNSNSLYPNIIKLTGHLNLLNKEVSYFTELIQIDEYQQRWYPRYTNYVESERKRFTSAQHLTEEMRELKNFN